jgi:SHS2 domain-containing protein
LTYQLIDHTADLGIIVKAPNVENLFIFAAQAMTDLIVKGDISEKTAIRDVLVEGLEEIPYLSEGGNLTVDSVDKLPKINGP